MSTTADVLTTLVDRGCVSVWVGALGSFSPQKFLDEASRLGMVIQVRNGESWIILGRIRQARVEHVA